LNPDTDPDPAFQVNPNTDPNPDPIRIQDFDDQKLKKKNTAETFFLFFLIKNCNLLMSKPQEKPSALKREHPAVQRMKFSTFFYVCGSFLPSWIRIAYPDLNTDPGPH
jgi:hypothetical protein